LYFTIYITKKLGSFLLIILGVVTGVINLFFGNAVSMIIVAILTTLDNKKEEKTSEEKRIRSHIIKMSRYDTNRK